MLKTEICTDEIQLMQLWDRLQDYDLDDDCSAFPFPSRLSSENGWSYLETFRVIEEYKRYLFLCIAAGHSVCPSEKVDQVWHLHLVYTHSYWDDLCKNVLQCPLHHNPSKGGESETEKHIQMYEQTLSDYKKFFNEEPPVDIWPDAVKRFGEDTNFRRVNLHHFWLVPKITNLFARLRIAAIPVLFFPLFGAVMYPLNLKGPEFLEFYWFYFIVIVLSGFVIRWGAKAEIESRTIKNPNLSTPYQAACMATNDKVLLATLVASLLKKGHLIIGKKQKEGLFSFWRKEYRFKPSESIPEKLVPIEQAAIQTATMNGTCNLSELSDGIKEEANDIRKILIGKRLLLHPVLYWASTKLPALFCLFLLLTGLFKIGIGIQLEKPVGYLVISSFITAYFTMLFYRGSPRTQQGERVLNKQKAKHFKLKTASNDGQMTTPDAALTVALFSASAISTGVLSEYSSLLRGCKESNFYSPTSGFTNNSSGGCGSGCGAGCGGGGGCGGGCGGCGGD